MLTIDTDVPTPPAASRRPRGYFSNALAAMKPGDSVLMPRSDEISFRQIAFQKKIKITGRKEGDDSIRFWIREQ